MSAPKPHFLLFSEAHRRSGSATDPSGVGPILAQADNSPPRGKWRFVLESLDSGKRLEVSDEEGEAGRDRLDLLAVVRGLEALDQPSRVTLVTPSRYVTRGLRYGLPQWRENQWRWERFGQLAPVNNSDLWQRIDGALRYHTLDCRMWRYDPPAESVEAVAERSPAENIAAAASDGVARPRGAPPRKIARRRPNRFWPRLKSAAQRLVSSGRRRYCAAGAGGVSVAH